MGLYRVGPLAADPLAAAAAFYADHLPLLDDGGAVLSVLFDPAAHGHHEWRAAAIAGLARTQAPRRVNGIVSDDPAAIAAALAYLEAGQGITGQLLQLDSHGAGVVLSCPA